VLISGTISDDETEAPANELVLLSVNGNETYFDYFYPDTKGTFHFFLNEATGIVNLVLQPLTNTDKTFNVSLTPNFLASEHQFSFDTIFVNPLQAEFIQNSLKATFYNKLFKGVSMDFSEEFQMISPYGMPFYGGFDGHVIPDQFVNLPNFEEIARELLIGVQYRNRNDGITIRMIDFENENYFTSEPLRLINGIPVFKNSILQSLKSTDIASIDLVKRERIFGDLRFRGVLAVSLNDKSNSWMAQQPNIFQLKMPCIQWASQPNYSNTDNITAMPDTRQQFFNQIIDAKESWSFSFELSDVKGNLEIIVEAITKSGEMYKTSKIISVQ
ncbi:MAG TPA: hypothetical protein VEP89_11455, partial [Draconibacterium sp.]|nr:hypothetical protein [Draconibacterium sp.]